MIATPKIEDPREPLRDEHGPIPTFPPLDFDEQGRPLPISDEERAARRDAAIRAIAAIGSMTDPEEPADLFEEGMRDIDSCRPEGFKLFEGMY